MAPGADVEIAGEAAADVALATGVEAVLAVPDFSPSPRPSRLGVSAPPLDTEDVSEFEHAAMHAKAIELIHRLREFMGNVLRTACRD